MLRFKFIPLFSLSILLQYCANPEENKETNNPAEQQVSGALSQLSFLEGTWVDTTTYGFKSVPQHLMERWTVYPDSLSGVGMTIKGTDTTITEYLSIRIVNDKLTYIANPMGRSLISFTQTPSEEGEFLFENPINDFPSIISYKLVEGTLKINLSGSHEGFERKVSMTYNKQ